MVNEIHTTTHNGDLAHVHRNLETRAGGAVSKKPSFDRPSRFDHFHRMAKLCIFGTSGVASYGLYFAADALGADMFTSFMISGVGSIVGCWLGWKIYQRFFS